MTARLSRHYCCHDSRLGLIVSEDAENKPEKIRTTVRMDAPLHERLTEYQHAVGKGRRRKEKPSLDLLIQEAVREYLDSKIPSGEPLPHPAVDPGSEPPLSSVPIAAPGHGATLSQSTKRGENIIDLRPGELPWVIRFVNILRSGTIAARGIKWNIMMVLKASGLWAHASNSLLPFPSEAAERAAREQIATVDRLIAESEEAPKVHRPDRKRRRDA